MNICFFNLQEHSGAAMVGGIERATYLLAKELRRRGHSVEFYFKESSHHFRIPLVSSLFPCLSKHSCSAGVCFRAFLKKHKIDVAIWHKGGSWDIPFPLKNLPCKLIVVWHSVPTWSDQLYIDRLLKRLKVRSYLAKRLVQSKFCSLLIRKFYEACFSRFFSYSCHYGDKFVLLSERFFPEFPLKKKFPEKVCAIPNIAPFEVQNVEILSKKKELVWVGRVEFPTKRPDHMLQIWHKLEDRFPDWSLRFVGDGDYLQGLKSLAKELGVQRVFFEGYQDPTPFYRTASIHGLTSTNESFGLVIVEAQAFGCVPIAFESYSSVHDIIEDGVNGYLIPPFDLDAYAEKLAELMSNPELRERLALNAQKSISKFSEKDIGDKWEKLLGGG